MLFEDNIKRKIATMLLEILLYHTKLKSNIKLLNKYPNLNLREATKHITNKIRVTKNWKSLGHKQAAGYF